jgi:hypothetical protein
MHILYHVAMWKICCNQRFVRLGVWLICRRPFVLLSMKLSVIYNWWCDILYAVKTTTHHDKPALPRECHGLPWAFSGNPCLHPSTPIPVHKGAGSDRYGSWVGYNARVSNEKVYDRFTWKLTGNALVCSCCLLGSIMIHCNRLSFWPESKEMIKNSPRYEHGIPLPLHIRKQISYWKRTSARLSSAQILNSTLK